MSGWWSGQSDHLCPQTPRCPLVRAKLGFPGERLLSQTGPVPCERPTDSEAQRASLCRQREGPPRHVHLARTLPSVHGPWSQRGKWCGQCEHLGSFARGRLSPVLAVTRPRGRGPCLRSRSGEPCRLGGPRGTAAHSVGLHVLPRQSCQVRWDQPLSPVSDRGLHCGWNWPRGRRCRAGSCCGSSLAPGLPEPPGGSAWPPPPPRSQAGQPHSCALGR